ncbi:MAG TPA: hypothetical protein VKD24_05805 [Candidatus Angelobacter sp.]|nr:hypothetical protein [Candidatus Angelobacter sp.]
MSTIRFVTNVPAELRLRSLEGKPVESQFGGMQHMFSAEEGAFYVSETVGAILAEQFRKLGVKAGEPVEITKAEVSRGNGRKSIQWTVTKPVAPESAAPPSELEHKLADSIAMVEARKQAQTPEQPAWARALSTQTRHVLDVYAELVAYASDRHGNLVRPDDIRTMMTTVFINLSKNSGGNANAA